MTLDEVLAKADELIEAGDIAGAKRLLDGHPVDWATLSTDDRARIEATGEYLAMLASAPEHRPVRPVK